MRRTVIAALAAAVVFAASARAAPRLGATLQGAPGGGVTVLKTAACGAAEAAGLEAGDTIVSINGRLISRGAEAAEAVAASGGHVSLVVQKAGGGFRQYEIDLHEAPDYKVAPRTMPPAQNDRPTAPEPGYRPAQGPRP